MCGITGIYLFNSSKKDSLPLVEVATKSLNQRGPDHQNTYTDNQKIAIGHARLSIIDTSDNANQPFVSDDGNYILSFNGEIYNYKELKEKYLKHISLKSTSDTEVLLYLLVEKGVAILNELNGFFAFSFYDKKNEKLLLVRDRYGIKPLIYYKDKEQFIFGSEIKSILKFGAKKEVNKSALFSYFQFNFIPEPQSILKDFHKLPAGSYLEIQHDKFEVKKWYSFELPEKYEHIDYKKSKEQLISKIEKSVERRMVSDVPLGTFLSGGTDSSVISYTAKKFNPNLQTFSIGFKDNEYIDETYYSDLVAKHLKTNHHHFNLSEEDLLHDIPSILDYIDEPFADSSSIAMNLLCKESSKHIKVALSGDGADELFSGYRRHSAEYFARNNKVKSVTINLFEPLWENLPKSRSSKSSDLFRKLNRFTKGYSKDLTKRYINWSSVLSKEEVQKLTGISQTSSLELSTQLSEAFNSVLFNDSKFLLQGDMLRKVDLMSMKNSLEVRVPFLDYELYEFAFSIPASFKIDGKATKKILKDAYKSYLPKELYSRPKKGFEVPLQKWLTNELSSSLVKEYLNEDFIIHQKIFNLNYINYLLKKLHSKNPEDTAATIWAVIVFNHWWKKYFLD